MGTFADSLFNILMIWVRAFVDALWSLFSSKDLTIPEYIGKNWLAIAAVICVAGLVIDRIVWLIRWRPYEKSRPKEKIKGSEKRSEAAAMPEAVPVAVKAALRKPEPAQERQGEDIRIYSRAAHMKDEREYPGMRYDAESRETSREETQHFSVIAQEGPGAKEVSARRNEIDEYRRKEQAERGAQLKAKREAMASKTAPKAAAELSGEEVPSENQNAAQEEYRRKMREYEKKRAQYEKDMEIYRRKKAEYDEAVRLKEQKKDAPKQAEPVNRLPDPPDWSAGMKRQTRRRTEGKGLLRRAAELIEPEEEDMRRVPGLGYHLSVTNHGEDHE